VGEGLPLKPGRGGGLPLAGCWMPTQLLPHSPSSVARGEKMWWKRQGDRSPVAITGKTGSARGKLICCQVKQVWIVRNKEKLKQHFPPTLPCSPGSLPCLQQTARGARGLRASTWSTPFLHRPPRTLVPLRLPHGPACVWGVALPEAHFRPVAAPRCGAAAASPQGARPAAPPWHPVRQMTLLVFGKAILAVQYCCFFLFFSQLFHMPNLSFRQVFRNSLLA